MNDDRLYKALFVALLKRRQSTAPGHGFCFKKGLNSIGASTIDYCLSFFLRASFRKAKGEREFELHVAMIHKGNLLEFVAVIEARKTEETQGQCGFFPEKVTVWRQIAVTRITSGIDKDVFCVAYLIPNVTTKIFERWAVDRKTGLTRDQAIELAGVMTPKHRPPTLRGVGYQNIATGKHHVFLANKFTLDASIIAIMHNSRWHVELFFKRIKQNQKINSFIGTNNNHVVIRQIWLAL